MDFSFVRSEQGNWEISLEEICRNEDEEWTLEEWTSFVSLCLRFFFSDSLRILSRKWNVGEMQVVRDWKKFGTRFVFVSESKKRFENFVEKMERILFVLLSSK